MYSNMFAYLTVLNTQDTKYFTKNEIVKDSVTQKTN